MSGRTERKPQTFHGRVTLREALQLQSYTVAQAATLAGVLDGTLIRTTNGNAGAACLAVYSGGSFKVIALGAAISAT